MNWQRVVKPPEGPSAMEGKAPAIMAGFGVAPPSASVEVRELADFIQPSPPTPIGSILTKDVRL
jgi:hypothetical protein